VCDHIILMAGSRVQLCGDTGTLLAEHKMTLEELVLAYMAGEDS